MCLSYRALATPARMEIIIAKKPTLLLNLKPSFFEEMLRRVNERRARATPPHCHRLRLSPKRMMEKITTKKGLEAFRVLTVVRGRSLSPTIPLIQEIVTRMALKIRLRCSVTLPLLRKGDIISADNAVAARSTQSTLLRFRLCFLATS